MSCERCGRTFAAPRGGRYCRPACRTAAYRDEKAAAEKALREELEALRLAVAAS